MKDLSTLNQLTMTLNPTSANTETLPSTHGRLTCVSQDLLGASWSFTRIAGHTSILITFAVCGTPDSSQVGVHVGEAGAGFAGEIGACAFEVPGIGGEICEGFGRRGWVCVDVGGGWGEACWSIGV